MRKGVAYLFRYQEVSRQANYRYLEALAIVEDPISAIQQLDDITTRKETKSGRGVRAFNPLCREDMQLFKAMMAGEHHIRGLSNADIRTTLEDSPHLRDLAHAPKKQSAKVSRILSRFHAHKLIAKIPRTRRWRVTIVESKSWLHPYVSEMLLFPNSSVRMPLPDLSCRKTKKS
jgi:hypothetical protein